MTTANRALKLLRPAAIVAMLLVALLSVTTAFAQQQTYTVQSGDTLFSIARSFGLSVSDLAFANGITNPDRILAGQVLNIPGEDDDTGDSTGGGTASSYTVVAGDTLFSLARRFGTTVDAFVAANDLENANQISVGQVLTVPSSSTGSPGIGGPTGTYTVSTGDTLSNIALRFNVTVAQLVAANNLTNPNLIFIGQELTIPGGTGAETGTTPSEDEGEEDADDEDEPGTITDIVVASENFTTLEAAVVAADLASTLAGEGPFTVFAPTDAAFAALPDGTLDSLLADPENALTPVLLYHVVSGNLDAAAVTSSDTLTTLNGASVTVSTDGGVMINNANVTTTDIVASNGTIHVIDAVLIPPAPETGGGDESDEAEEDVSEDEATDTEATE